MDEFESSFVHGWEHNLELPVWEDTALVDIKFAEEIH